MRSSPLVLLLGGVAIAAVPLAYYFAKRFYWRKPEMMHASLTHVPPPAHLEWGVSLRQGRRMGMEDRCLVSEVVFASEPTGIIKDGASLACCARRMTLFAVFDGHGGPYTADFAAKQFASMLQQAAGVPNTHNGTPTFSSGPSPVCDQMDVQGQGLVSSFHHNQASTELRNNAATHAILSEAFDACDKAFTTMHHTRFRCGTTALALLYDASSRSLHCANAGDCRAVLCRGGLAVRLTTDHKPSHVPEAERVRRAGGVVGRDPQEGSSGPLRVYSRSGAGGLAVTRALGDAFLKNVRGRSRVGNQSLVLAQPECESFGLSLPLAPPAAPAPALCLACSPVLCENAPFVPPSNRSTSPGAAADACSERTGSMAACVRCGRDCANPPLAAFAPVAAHSSAPLCSPACSSCVPTQPPASPPCSHEHDRFVVLASDGVWDVMQDQEAVDVVTAALYHAHARTPSPPPSAVGESHKHTYTHLRTGTHAQLAADALVSEAYERGSTDNLSAVVVVFPAHTF